MKTKSITQDQITLDEYSWTLIEYSFGSSKEARIELGKMLNSCDTCPFRATLGDKRQQNCEVCPYRMQMQVIGESLWNADKRVSSRRQKAVKKGAAH